MAPEYLRRRESVKQIGFPWASQTQFLGSLALAKM
jgi:hypothetical protein